jgi:hypothetical protein
MIPRDKKKHILVGYLITFVIGIILISIIDVSIMYFLAIAIGTIAGIYKEVKDKLKGGIFDRGDLLATFVGSMFAAPCVFVVHTYLIPLF